MSVTYLTVEGEILSQTSVGVDSDYLPDSLGSVVGMLDSHQAVMATRIYWPYGEVQTETGDWSNAPMGFVGSLGYYGDGYTRYRFLQCNLGRWLTVDPLWPNEDAFRYVRNNPTTSTDSLGLAACDVPPGAKHPIPMVPVSPKPRPKPPSGTALVCEQMCTLVCNPISSPIENAACGELCKKACAGYGKARPDEPPYWGLCRPFRSDDPADSSCEDCVRRVCGAFSGQQQGICLNRGDEMCSGIRALG